MLDDQVLSDMAQQLVRQGGVLAVMLGGSRARGEHGPGSDVDLGLYYRPPLDVSALGALALQFGGAQARVTAPGEWGPWVDGGSWLAVQGVAVDWIYRDLDRVKRTWEAAREGRYTFHAQVGHPLGVPDFAYVGEVALGVVLADATGEVTELRAAAADYPPLLADALTAGLWEAAFLLDLARKAIPRADTAYVAGCLFRAILLCAHALHGRSRRWLINEKGAITAAGRLPTSPPEFAVRAHRILAHVGEQPQDLHAALTATVDLLSDVTSACRAGVE